MARQPSDSSFTGSVPDAYDHLLVPLLFESYAEDLAHRAQRRVPTSTLEVAAGTGVVTRRLGRSLDPSARLTASDLNPAMLATAIARPVAHEVSWCAADALALPFPSESFDLALCQFGAMFFPDRVRGYAEIRRCLQPGGAFVFNVWDAIEHNDFAAVVTDALAEVFPDDPPRFMARTPHGYHDETMILAELADAGFTGPVAVERVERRSAAPSPEFAARAFCLGTPLRNELEARDPARLDEAIETAARRLRSRFGDDDLDGSMVALVVTAIADESAAE